MADEKDRLGDKLHHAERAREDQWARQRDEEIIERLRRKYVKPIHCPQCDKNLDARVAIGVGGMACPFHDGAWCDAEALMQIVARLENAAAIHHESLGEKAFIRVSELVEDLRHKHPKEIDCFDCGTRLDAKLQSRLARRDWRGWPAQTTTARGSMRACLRKFVDDWISPLASRASDEATGPPQSARSRTTTDLALTS